MRFHRLLSFSVLGTVRQKTSSHSVCELEWAFLKDRNLQVELLGGRVWIFNANCPPTVYNNICFPSSFKHLMVSAFFAFASLMGGKWLLIWCFNLYFTSYWWDWVSFHDCWLFVFLPLLRNASLLLGCLVIYGNVLYINLLSFIYVWNIYSQHFEVVSYLLTMWHLCKIKVVNFTLKYISLLLCVFSGLSFIPNPSGSQMGAVCFLVATWQCHEMYFGCRPVARSQGCCQTPHSAQESP